MTCLPNKFLRRSIYFQYFACTRYLKVNSNHVVGLCQMNHGIITLINLCPRIYTKLLQMQMRVVIIKSICPKREKIFIIYLLYFYKKSLLTWFMSCFQDSMGDTVLECGWSSWNRTNWVLETMPVWLACFSTFGA